MNYTALFIGTIIAYILGGLWYSPKLFGNSWMKHVGLSKKDVEKCSKQGMAKLYISQFLSTLLMGFILFKIFTMTSTTGLMNSLQLAGLLWLGFIGTVSFGKILWENKSMHLWVINNGHSLSTLLILATSYALI